MKSIEEVRNDNARKLNKMRKYTRNVILPRRCLKNSLEHYLKQCEIAYKLEEEGFEYVVEAEFSNGKVADIFVLDIDFVYEILNSEKTEECKKKVESYPVKKVIMIKLRR